MRKWEPSDGNDYCSLGEDGKRWYTVMVGDKLKYRSKLDGDRSYIPHKVFGLCS